MSKPILKMTNPPAIRKPLVDSPKNLNKNCPDRVKMIKVIKATIVARRTIALRSLFDRPWVIVRNTGMVPNGFVSVKKEVKHKSVKGIYGTIRLKYHIQNKYKKEKFILNHKLIRRYKHILGLETVKRTKKGLSVSKAKEKNLTNKAQYLIECNFNSDVPNQKYSSDVSAVVN